MNNDRNNNAFTLIELMVSIGIIAILISIAIPALSGVRQRARDAIGLSNLRQTSVAMENYVQAYGGWLPYAKEGSGFRLTPEVPPSSVIRPGYWDTSSYWSSLFHEVAPWDQWFGMWVYPDPRRPTSKPWAIDSTSDSPFSNGVSSLEYARSLYARPEIWESGGIIEDRDSVLRGVRHSEVRYPSAKVSLFDSELCARVRCDDPKTVKRAMLFVDGHAAMKALSDANAPVKGRLPELAAYGALAVHDTAGGARGRDY